MHSVVPSFTSHSVQPVEYTARIVFILDREELGVIAAEECLLKVGLVNVTLVQVSATSRRKVLQLFHPHIRNLRLQGDVGVVVHLVVWHTKDNIHQRGAEGGIDSVLDILGEGGLIADDTGQNASALENGLDSSLQGFYFGVIEKYVALNKSSANVGDSDVVLWD